MRQSADAGKLNRLDALGRALQSTFPGSGDAPLARELLRMLSGGSPVGAPELAGAAGRSQGDVVARLARWPNVERDEAGRVVAFSGLTLRPTPHAFTLGGRELHTWCAWDALFLPALLEGVADVRSACPISDSKIQLTVTPAGITSSRPGDVYVSFPPVTAADTRDIIGTFCCHVFFLAGRDAARAWQETRPSDELLELDAAYDLGRRAVAPLLETSSSTVTEASC